MVTQNASRCWWLVIYLQQNHATNEQAAIFICALQLQNTGHMGQLSSLLCCRTSFQQSGPPIRRLSPYVVSSLIFVWEVHRMLILLMAFPQTQRFRGF